MAADYSNSSASIAHRDRRDVIQQVQEITGLDVNIINQTIEACKDNAGYYSLEQVISVLLDENPRIDDPLAVLPVNSSNRQASPVNAKTNSGAMPSRSAQAGKRSTSDDLVAVSSSGAGQAAADEDLQRAILLSQESMEQLIEESDIAQRNPADEPAGLKNIGNTCWFNSIVQALYTLPYFRQLILDYRGVEASRTLTNHELQAVDFTRELRYLFALMLSSPRRSINPDQVIKKLKKTRKLSGVDFSHEDCSEFATHLIDLVEQAFETFGKNLPTNDEQQPAPANPVNALVTGEVLIERAEHESIREALRQINIQLNDSTNVYDGLETLWLGSSDDSLSQQQSTLEQRWLTRLPPVLFICLNRYRFSPTTKQTSKILAPFEFYPELYLDRYMLSNRELIAQKRDVARQLYAQLHELENALNSYTKYPCQDQSFSLANAVRAVYEYSTGRRLDSSADAVPVQPPPQMSDEQLRLIETMLPQWLTQIEEKCTSIRAEIEQIKQELKQLYDKPNLKQARYTLHAVCVHGGSVSSGHFWTYVYHTDKQKWFRYNDNEVTECQWSDVFEAGIGGGPSSIDGEAARSPSAYLLIYINDEQRDSCSNVHCEMTADLRRVLNEDVSLLQQQLESVQLDQLYTQLRSSVDYIEETQPRHHTLAIPTFSDGYNSFDGEVVEPVADVTLSALRAHGMQLTTVPIGYLMQDIVDDEIRKYAPLPHSLTSNPLHFDRRLEHILSYFSANRIDRIYRERVIYDIIRRLPIPKDDIRLEILQMQAQIACHKMPMSDEQFREYHKILTDYRDFRSIIAAFLGGCQLMKLGTYDEAIQCFCVASEYNVRLSQRGALPMRAMDSGLLFKTRRLCFQHWNDMALHRFKTDPSYRLDNMIDHFLPCLLQLKTNTTDDQVYVSEIQDAWCSLFDKFEPSVRMNSLGMLVERSHKPPSSRHYHSISIDRYQLVKRYEQTVRDLTSRYAMVLERRNDHSTPPRPDHTLNLVPSISIPVHRLPTDSREVPTTSLNDDERDSFRRP